MSDESSRSDQASPDEPPRHSAEEDQAFNERLETMSDFARLALDASRDGMEEAHAAVDKGDEAAYDSWLGRRWPLLALAGAILLVIFALVLIYMFGSGDDLSAPLAEEGSAASADAPADGGSGSSDAAADDTALTGTWRVFLDDSQETPVYDVPFGSGGSVAVVYPDTPEPWTVTDWDFTADGPDVVVVLTCQVQSGDGTIIEWPERLEMIHAGDEMRGVWSGEQWDYSPDDESPEVVRLGWEVAAPAAYARPAE